MALTLERLEALRLQAYREAGYEVRAFEDGTVGVFRCPAKTIQLMNRFAELVARELPKETT